MEFSAGIISYLAGVTVRSLGLATLALIAVLVLRLKSAAARHAVCTVLVAGMLALAALTPLLPPMSVRVLPGVAPAPAAVFPVVPRAATDIRNEPLILSNAPSARTSWPTWQQWGMAIYAVCALALLLRLAFGYLFTRRLVAASRPIDRPWSHDVLESSWISVPMTAGCLHPKILLPQGWEQWNEPKLQAVLAHERSHITRGDWAIAVMAGINRSLFWFHPLAWWLERKLAFLAEQAADDAALLQVGTETYAEALLDMAAAVNAGQGRLIWEAMAMANVSEVRQRIERILDETRQIPKAITRQRWLALVACSLPLIYVSSVVKLAPAQTAPPPAIAELLTGQRQLTASDAAQMEQYLAANPQDLDVRSKLVLYYFTSGTRDQRLRHIFWMIANHPESKQAVFTSRGITPGNSSFNDAVDYARAASLWKQQAAAHANDPQVEANAAEFLSQPGGDFNEAERLLIAARSQQPQNSEWTNRLGRLYGQAIMGSAGDPRYPNLDAALAARVIPELENSTDGVLMNYVGRILRTSAVRPEPGKELPPGFPNLDEHPLLVPIVDLGNRLMTRAAQYGVPTAGAGIPILSATIQQVPTSAPAGTPPPSVRVTEDAAPAVLHNVEPVYPELAQRARIQGVVLLTVTVGTDGRVQYVQVISGHPLFIPPTLDAVKQRIYAPVPVVSSFPVRVYFKMDFGKPPDVVSPAVVAPSNAEDLPHPQRVKMGSMVYASKLLTKVDPVYPEAARAAGIQGPVTLDIIVGTDGRVMSVEPKDGHPVLAAAAVEAVRQWTYDITRLNGNPVQVQSQVTVPFELH